MPCWGWSGHRITIFRESVVHAVHALSCNEYEKKRRKDRSWISSLSLKISASEVRRCQRSDPRNIVGKAQQVCPSSDGAGIRDLRDSVLLLPFSVTHMFLKALHGIHNIPPKLEILLSAFSSSLLFFCLFSWVQSVERSVSLNGVIGRGCKDRLLRISILGTVLDGLRITVQDWMLRLSDVVKAVVLWVYLVRCCAFPRVRWTIKQTTLAPLNHQAKQVVIDKSVLK